MFFFEFSSHIVYYAVLIRGPHPIVGSCWLFYRVVCVCPCPPSHFLCPPPFPFGNHMVLRYVMRLFLFGKDVHLYPFLESTSKKRHMILVFLCLTSLSVSSLLPSWLLDMAWCSPFYGWAVTALCACMHLVYPFICAYPLRLHPCIGYCT